MSDFFKITDFLEPVQLSVISQDEPYHNGQIGNSIILYENEFPDITEADVVFVSCAEERGKGPGKKPAGQDLIRHEFYKLYNWHSTLTLADLGNVKTGASLADTYAALKAVVRDITAAGKTVVIIGGSHDLTLAQYYACSDNRKLIEAACIDARIDLDMNSMAKADHFLMEMLTGEPNFIRHYNHIGFQSYLVHPHMLETLDKLRFDCFRLGKVRENMEEMEPVLRQADLVTFDIAAVANAFIPGNSLPNGFTGDEACALMRYAGLSPTARSIGIYGYDAMKDPSDVTAKQISQMLWYFLEGRNRGSRGDQRQFHRDSPVGRDEVQRGQHLESFYIPRPCRPSDTQLHK